MQTLSFVLAIFVPSERKRGEGDILSLVEQCARYLEVSGSIPAQLHLFINFQISPASQLIMEVNIIQMYVYSFLI